MFLAKVQGQIVASQKDAALNGMRLVIVEPLKVDYPAEGGGSFSATGRAIVAIDRIGAGEGQLVMIVQGSSARMADGCNKMPVDAVVVGLVNEAMVKGKKIDLSNM
ncbi:MAG: ethanolamine utilization protein EutN [Planctomycetes bacterium]|nr:ethanolamine utilization protein EutN [Planctomycetota bacterium]